MIGSEGSNLELKIKTFNLRNAICLLSNAWDKLPSTAIKKCWNVLMYPNDHWTDEDNIPLNVVRAELVNENAIIASVANYLHEITAENSISNDEMNDWIYENLDYGTNYPAESQVEEISSADETIVELAPALSKIKAETAISSFNTCIQWAEENEIPLKDILLLQDIREMAVQKNISCNKTQSKISDFF